MKIKKADFLVVNNDWGRGAAEDFGKMLKDEMFRSALVETMDQSAQDMSAQLSKIKASDADTLFVTTAVEQLTLVLKQATALGIKKQIITTGGSQNPDQLIEQAGVAANGTYHLTSFAPWYPGGIRRTRPSTQVLRRASGRSAASTSPALTEELPRL